MMLQRVESRLSTAVGRRLASLNLTTTQFGVLEFLDANGPSSQKAISDGMCTSGGNITVVMDNLLKRGFVSRKVNPMDRRAAIVTLTPSGRMAIAEARPIAGKALKAAMDSLGTEAMEDFCGHLAKIEKALD